MLYSKKLISLSNGLSLAAHYYRGSDHAPVICIPGLTRNASDFEDLAPKIAATGRDVVAVSLRGRGDSGWDPDYKNYHPSVYANDILAVLDHEKIQHAIFIGTSLGGIVTMLVNELAPNRVAAAILNDVGPDIAPEGIARIVGYVGRGTTAGPAASIEEAAARIKKVQAVAFPDFDESQWLEFARRTYRKRDNGQWELDYDPNIAQALAESGPAPDLWNAFESLRDTPTLVIRGAISDILTPPIVDKMRGAHTKFELAEIPCVGHAPTLTEPAAWAAIEAFLGAVD